MNARLLILIAVAGILAIGLALRPIEPKKSDENVNSYLVEGDKTLREIQDEQIPFILRDLKGEEPPEAPVFHVDVEVDRTSGKNRLVFHLTEEHGYYVDQPRLEFWYTDGTIESPEDSPLSIEQPFELFLKANDTLSFCIEIVHPELARIGGDIGNTSNWKARLIDYGNCFVANPDPLPRIGDAGACH